MAASRDDFVIAIRSAFLKKENKQRFSLIGLILSSIVLIVLSNLNFKAINYLKTGINEIVYRASFIASIPEQQIQKGIVIANDHFAMYSQFEDLKEKVKGLESKKHSIDYLESENSRLRKLIDEYIAGSDELVAKVLLVNYSTSRALLVSDLNSKVPVVIEPGNVQSILSGSGKEHGKIEYFKDISEIQDKSIVFTSGSGGIFKSGIPIGTITEKEQSDNYITQFFSNLSQLTFVKLVSFEKEDVN